MRERRFISQSGSVADGDADSSGGGASHVADGYLQGSEIAVVRGGPEVEPGDMDPHFDGTHGPASVAVLNEPLVVARQDDGRVLDQLDIIEVRLHVVDHAN